MMNKKKKKRQNIVIALFNILSILSNVSRVDLEEI